MTYAPIKRVGLASGLVIIADWNSEVVKNSNHRGAIFDIVLASEVDAVSIVFNVQGRYPDGTWRTILASAAKTANGAFSLIVYPGAVAVSNAVVNEPLPQFVRLQADGTWDGTDAITLTAVCTLVP